MFFERRPNTDISLAIQAFHTTGTVPVLKDEYILSSIQAFHKTKQERKDNCRVTLKDEQQNTTVILQGMGMDAFSKQHVHDLLLNATHIQIDGI